MLTTLGRVLYYRAYQLNESGGPGALEAVREGLAAAERAAARAPQDPEVPFVRCLLHQSEATALFRAGQPRATALHQTVESGEEALSLHVARGILLQPILGQALVGLASEALRSGGDPGPDMSRGLGLLDAAYEALPGQVAIAGQVASARYDAAELAAMAGQDPRPHIERALAAVDDALGREPDLAAVQAIKAEVLSLEADRLLQAGEDPLPTLAEARQLLDRSAAGMEGDVASQDTRGRLALVEAGWSARQGRDPAAPLARAERTFQELTRAHPEVVVGHQGLARCELQRASWIAGRGGSPADAARRGLDSLARALERDPRDPRLALMRAQLLALAGDRPGAQRTLEQAWAVSPLVKSSRDSREAEAAIR